ncbi:uncharacterized protein ACA1_048610 [Acanthamoeba castellanii str. Neff]|uniref:Uncharacterized protein n=1 Tax=Acanthamoeba castellanii (strain ATCC 30010 / Neff) TaxID=1257118 RepID=L8GEC5_ACACF|nr:uncharacterized protein ACA1_048610 [Acanthamoeba castellanii str. Neff]ELR11058.1 hypothetical protein ACA1_048610 [Acanthamoeba castellanii str. Neff]
MPDLKPIHAIMHFKIYQGLDVTLKKALLLKVYKGEYSWKDMEQEASIIKGLCEGARCSYGAS